MHIAEKNIPLCRGEGGEHNDIFCTEYGVDGEVGASLKKTTPKTNLSSRTNRRKKDLCGRKLIFY